MVFGVSGYCQSKPGHSSRGDPYLVKLAIIPCDSLVRLLSACGKADPCCENKMSIHQQPLNSILLNTPRPSRWPVVSSFFAQVSHRWQRGAAIRALEMLDDRLLEDIGIARNEIPRIAGGLSCVPSDSTVSGAGTRRTPGFFR